MSGVFHVCHVTDHRCIPAKQYADKRGDRFKAENDLHSFCVSDTLLLCEFFEVDLPRDEAESLGQHVGSGVSTACLVGVNLAGCHDVSGPMLITEGAMDSG